MNLVMKRNSYFGNDQHIESLAEPFSLYRVNNCFSCDLISYQIRVLSYWIYIVQYVKGKKAGKVAPYA
jgi:hypothetical protein